MTARMILIVTVVTIALSHSMSHTIGHAEDNVDRVNTISYDEERGVIVGSSNGVKVGEQETIRLGYVKELALAPNTDAAWISSDNGLLQIDLETGALNWVVPNVPASSLAVDAEGGLWVGTNGWGILHVSPDKEASDDEQQTCGTDYACDWFTMSNGIPSNNIISTFTSKDGSIWSGTPEGAAVYNGTAWNPVEDLKGRWVYTFAEVEQQVFAGTDDGVFVKTTDANKWQQLKETKGQIISTMLPVDENFYAVTIDGSLVRYEPSATFSWTVPVNWNFPNISGEASDKRVTSMVSPGIEEQYVVLGYSDGTIKAFDKPGWETILRMIP